MGQAPVPFLGAYTATHVHVPAHIVVLEDDRDDQGIGRDGDRYHGHVEDDQQVIGLGLELVVKVPEYGRSDVHAEALVGGHRGPVVRRVEFWHSRRRHPRVLVQALRHDSKMYEAPRGDSACVGPPWKRERIRSSPATGMENASFRVGLGSTEKPAGIERAIVTRGCSPSAVLFTARPGGRSTEEHSSLGLYPLSIFLRVDSITGIHKGPGARRVRQLTMEFVAGILYVAIDPLVLLHSSPLFYYSI